MFQTEKISTHDKREFYRQLNASLKGLISGEPFWLANVSNAASLLFVTLSDVNWAGFYLCKEGELILGPFQGKPACIRIALGKGVCGTAASQRKVQVVPDIHEFPGHIACDAESQSEIVLPIIRNNRLIGVLDIDSPVLRRFDNEDALGLQKFVDTLNEYIDWPESF